MATSYEDIIYPLLLKTTGFKLLEEEIKQRVANAKLRAKPVFELCGGIDSVFGVKPRFQAEYKDWVQNFDTDDGFHSIQSFTSHVEIVNVINDHFGVDVKTYNCKRETLINGDRWRGNRPPITSFPQWVYSRLQEVYEDEITNTSKKVMQQLRKYQTGEEYVQDAKEALVTFCKHKVSKALMPWRKMPNDVLQEAIEQFVANSILDE